jgi:serine/threonine protein kinase
MAMATSPSVSELLSRWHELQQQGRTLSPEALCAECPQLLPDLKREIAAVAAMEGFLGVAAGHPRTPAGTPGKEDEPVMQSPRPAERDASLHGAGAVLPAPRPDDPDATHYTPLPPAPAAAAPSDWPAVPGYEILGELGRGGMGVVYKARHIKLKRLVALKMILSGAHAGLADLARFYAEAEAIARLQHPNIVQIYEVGDSHGRPYLALEFVEGGSLAARLTGQPLPPEEAAALIETLARAVHAAHAAGIVHRDLKPANILLAVVSCQLSVVSQAGETSSSLTTDNWQLTTTPKITDFGVAKRLDQQQGQTQSGAILGTLSYMAPEQAGGRRQEVGPAVDIYSLGAILYELVAGRPPFRAATLLDTLLQVLNDEPIPPGRLNPQLPRALETICLKCLQKERHRRYADAAALADDLQRFRAGTTIRARPVGMGARLLRGCRRHPGRLALAVLSGLSLALLVVLLSGIGRHDPVPGPAAGAPTSDSPSDRPVPSAVDLEVAGLTVFHHRANPSVPIGLLGPSSSQARFKDDVRIRVRLNQPGYCYLLAFNPDGMEQPCYPSDVADPPPQSRSFDFPPELDRYFPLNDGIGLQAFVLLASREPLPSYKQWRANNGRAPWQAVRADGFWSFDGERFVNGPRGEVMQRPSLKKVPRAFEELCAFFKDRPGIDAIEAVAFPVVPKE